MLLYCGAFAAACCWGPRSLEPPLLDDVLEPDSLPNVLPPTNHAAVISAIAASTATGESGDSSFLGTGSSAPQRRQEAVCFGGRPHGGQAPATFSGES